MAYTGQQVWGMKPAVRRPRRQRSSPGLLDILVQPVSIAGVLYVKAMLFCLTVRVGRAEWHEHVPRNAGLLQVSLEN